MSEYQYYEFRAVDRPLTQREMRELRALSTRATITPTSFVNHYEWGDFKGDPDVLMEKYFDAHVYVANWGTHQLTFRIPRQILDLQTASPYCSAEILRVRQTKDFVILDFLFEDQNREWDDGGGWLDSLISLRTDLMRGDLRCLYLSWLLCAQKAGLSKHEVEPFVPPGLRQLTAPLESLTRFAGLDGELIRAAAERSPNRLAERVSQSKLAAWITNLPERDKGALLLEIAEKGHAHSQAALLGHFRQHLASAKQRGKVQNSRRRTVAELLESARVLADRRNQREAQRQAAAEARQKEREAAARAKYLSKLAGREAHIWERVDALVRTKQPNNYRRAVSHIVDLRDLASRCKKEIAFNSTLERLRATHHKKSAFLRRLEEPGL